MTSPSEQNQIDKLKIQEFLLGCGYDETEIEKMWSETALVSDKLIESTFEKAFSDIENTVEEGLLKNCTTLWLLLRKSPKISQKCHEYAKKLIHELKTLFLAQDYVPDRMMPLYNGCIQILPILRDLQNEQERTSFDRFFVKFVQDEDLDDLLRWNVQSILGIETPESIQVDDEIQKQRDEIRDLLAEKDVE